MNDMIANLELIKDKDDYAVDDDITVNVKFSLTGKAVSYTHLTLPTKA